MLKPKDIERILTNLMEAMPEGLKLLPSDLKHNIKGALQGALSRLDLITREEFDAQVGVLLRTREKLEDMVQELQQNNPKDESP